MWAAQYYRVLHKPNRWMTSGGLGTMGYGFPAASWCSSCASLRNLLYDVAGEASFLMTYTRNVYHAVQNN